ncbi:MAG: bi-domain-containing oxidoreductase [Terriglobia bacterium]
MKQLVQSYRSGRLQVEDVPVPALRPAGVLVQNAASLISPGTERAQLELARSSLLRKAWERPEHLRQVLRSARQEGWLTTYRKAMDRLDTPVAIGYCSAGIVMEVGREAGPFQVGDRVACAGEGHGAHAEVVYVPKTMCARVPDRVPLEHAAVAPLGAIALESLRQSNVVLGERVAVVGLGLVGLLIVQLLEAAGCHVLAADPEPVRVERALELGATLACPVDQLETMAAHFTGERGVDCVILAAAARSAEPVELAGRIAREKGRVVVVGAFPIDVPRTLFYQKELSLTLSRAFGAGTYDPEFVERGRDYPYSYVRWTAGRHLEEFLSQMARGRVRVDSLLTHRFPVERAAEAYHLLEEPSPRPLGILFFYDVGKELDRHLSRSPQGKAPGRLTVVPPAGAVDEIRLGVIGAGKFAQTYLLPHFRRPQVRLVTVANATGPSATHVARKFGFTERCCDADGVVADPRINCVLIATRHDLHAPLAAAALRAGKTVFVEKPLALEEEGLRQVAAAARQAGGCILVGFNRRFSPLARRVREFFARRQGPLVMTYRVNAAALPPDHWIYDPQEGGGRVRSEVCHYIDFLQSMAGAPPVRLHAQSVRNLPAQAHPEDNLQVTLQFGDGSTGTITYTTVGDPALARERVEIFGEKAAAEINNFRTAHLYRQNRTRRHWLLHQDMGHRDEVSAFLEAVSSGGAMPIPLEEILLSSLATLRVVDSLQQGQPVLVDPDSLGWADA